MRTSEQKFEVNAFVPVSILFTVSVCAGACVLVNILLFGCMHMCVHVCRFVCFHVHACIICVHAHALNVELYEC